MQSNPLISGVIKKMSSPRNAPRRKAVNVQKVGNYGHVIWAHELECGHTITRKRKSPNGILGCTKCLNASDFEEMSQALTVPQEAPFDDGLSEAEKQAMKYKAILAGRFNIPTEQIDVHIQSALDGMMRVESATISLTRRQLRALD